MPDVIQTCPLARNVTSKTTVLWQGAPQTPGASKKNRRGRCFTVFGLRGPSTFFFHFHYQRSQARFIYHLALVVRGKIVTMLDVIQTCPLVRSVTSKTAVAFETSRRRFFAVFCLWGPSAGPRTGKRQPSTRDRPGERVGTSGTAY